MAAPTGSIFNTYSTKIEEIINKTVGIFLPTFDKVWEDSIVSSQGVGSVSDLGRDFMIIKTFQGGLTGVVEPGGPGSDFTLYGDPSNTSLGAKLFTQGLSRTFPDATQGMNQATYRLGIPMRSMVTNLMLTLGELQAEATDAFIGEVVAPKMEGFARYLTQVLCNYWYLSQNNYYRLFALAGSDGTGWDQTTGTTYSATTNGVLMVDTTYDNYAVDRVMVGMRVQFYDSTGATLRATASGANVFVCTAVDEATGKLFFMASDGATVASTFTNGDICVLANSKGSSSTPFASSPYFTGIAGINSWMKFGAGSDDNYLLGGERVGTAYGFNHNIDVTVHPEFKSLGFNAGGNPITEHYLRKILRRFHSSKHKYGHFIDCLIASDGVWLAYEAQKIGREWRDRTGRLSTIRKEGSDNSSLNEGVLFEFDGRRYEGYTSTYVESGTMYGIRKSKNWKRYVPPDVRGTKRFERTEAWNPFRFVGGALTGTGSNQIPIYSVASNRTFVTEGVQMPGYLRMQLVPDQVTGIKITNIAEDRIYAAQ